MGGRRGGGAETGGWRRGGPGSGMGPSTCEGGGSGQCRGGGRTGLQVQIHSQAMAPWRGRSIMQAGMQQAVGRNREKRQPKEERALREKQPQRHRSTDRPGDAATKRRAKASHRILHEDVVEDCSSPGHALFNLIEK